MPTRDDPTDEELASAIINVHKQLREAILARCRASSCDDLAKVTTDEGAGDETFAIDVAAEEILPEALEREMRRLKTSMVVLFEGQREPLVVPHGVAAEEAEFRSIWDPLDGSRMLAYQMHSGWILTAVAPNFGERTRLIHATVAVQTEVPLLNQREAAVLVATARLHLPSRSDHFVDTQTGEQRPLRLSASRAKTLERGFVANECYFDGPSGLLTEIEEKILLRLLGPAQPGAARVWRDTQLSSAGTLYNLLSGKVRWAHDFRPLVRRQLAARGLSPSLCAHPYDLCTAPLLCASSDVVLTDPLEGYFEANMTLEDDVAWSAYANREIATQMRPIVKEVLQEILGETP